MLMFVSRISFTDTFIILSTVKPWEEVLLDLETFGGGA